MAIHCCFSLINRPPKQPERPEAPKSCRFSAANHSVMNESEDTIDKIKFEPNHQDADESSFSSIHRHNRFDYNSQQLHSSEQEPYFSYSTSSSLSLINGRNLNELRHFGGSNGRSSSSSSSAAATASKNNNKLLIIDCVNQESSKISGNFNYQTDSTIHHHFASPTSTTTSTTYQFELWRESDEQNLLLVTKKTSERPRFIINYSLFDEWLDQEFVYSIYILAYNNQGKSDHLLKITFGQPEQLLQQHEQKRQLFKLVPYSLLFNDQLNSTHNQSKLFRSSNFTRPFTLLSAGSLYKGNRRQKFFFTQRNHPLRSGFSHHYRASLKRCKEGYYLATQALDLQKMIRQRTCSVCALSSRQA